jgi:voltage-gated potassium channel
MLFNIIKQDQLEKFKRDAYVVIYGTNTFWGRFFDVTLLIIIILSVLVFSLDSIPTLYKKYHLLFLILEWTFTIFFTIEYFVRIWIAKKPRQYIFSFYGIIDLLAILPTYLLFFIEGSKVLVTIRVLRLLRVLRILKLMKFLSEAEKLRNAFYKSRRKVAVFLGFVLTLAVLLGSLMYVIEGPNSGFTSIPQGIYWVIVTLTTVGYGDITPTTNLGQFIASIIMIIGYGVIAVPTGLVTAEIVSQKTTEDEIEKRNSKIGKCTFCETPLAFKNAKYCHNCGEEVV